METENCELRDGARLISRLTQAEASSMVREGTARRINGRRYSLITHAKPSDSPEDAGMLRVRDMDLAVGAAHCATVEEHERLAGWGFKAIKSKLIETLRPCACKSCHVDRTGKDQVFAARA